jgi:hypothetical protein
MLETALNPKQEILFTTASRVIPLEPIPNTTIAPRSGVTQKRGQRMRAPVEKLSPMEKNHAGPCGF